MKKKLKLKLSTRTSTIIISFAILVGSIALGLWAIDMDSQVNHRDSTGTIIQMYDCPRSHYKSTHVTNEFIMVVREDSGHAYDLKVSATTFATHKIGDRITFKDLSKSTLDEDTTFAWCLLFILCLILASISLVTFLRALFNKDFPE